MKRIAGKIAALIAVFCATVFCANCDTDSQILDVVEDECYQNTNPRLGELYYLVGPANGEIPVAKPAVVKSGERLVVEIEYQDEECNVGDGILYYALDEGAWQESASALRGFEGCTSVTDQPIVFAPNIDALTAGDHALDVYVSDLCNDISDIVTSSFRILDTE